jgi:nitrite reductase/ring-hydroxylating ferredoxin subunit
MATSGYTLPAASMIHLCKTGDIPENGVIRVSPAGRKPIAVYNLGGDFRATDDRCSHGDALLSAGMVEGGLIICPLHFGSFDIRTGVAVDAPCSRDIRIYPVVVAGDDLFLPEAS